jgi:hypothetical protein
MSATGVAEPRQETTLQKATVAILMDICAAVSALIWRTTWIVRQAAESCTSANFKETKKKNGQVPISKKQRKQSFMAVGTPGLLS